MVLMFVNVGIGLWFIFRHESKTDRPGEAQMREQIAKSIERAGALTPAPNALGITEITIPAEKKLDPSQIGWSQLFPSLEDLLRRCSDAGRLSILVDRSKSGI